MFPFGKTLRSFNGGNKYGHQGSQRESELSENDYYTHYRGLDDDIARWKQVDPEDKADESPYVSMGNNPVSNTDVLGDDWIDKIAGAIIGVVTNVIPASTGARALYNPNDASDYNHTLRDSDNGMLVVGAAATIFGGDAMAGGAGTAAVGLAVSATGVGAIAGVPTAAGGGITAGAGAIVAGVGALTVMNAMNNQAGGYNYGGKKDTESSTSKEAFGKAKDSNGIPRSQQPDKTIKPNTPEGKKAGLDNRNVKQYEFTNSKGEKINIRQDKAAKYNDGGKGDQGKHFNAGKKGKEGDQHHNYR